jgi:hypothetical protein
MRADGVIHGVRSEIDLSGPCDGAQMDGCTGEERLIAKRLQDRSGDVVSTQAWPQIDRSSRAIDKLNLENTVADDSEVTHSPCGTRLDRRLYGSGAIRFGCCIRLHSSQSSISSSRCSAAHSNTSARARRGSDPRKTLKSRKSISASCSA